MGPTTLYALLVSGRSSRLSAETENDPMIRHSPSRPRSAAVSLWAPFYRI